MYAEPVKIFVLMVLLLVCDTETVNSDVCNCTPLKQCSSFLLYFKSLQKPLTPTAIQFMRSKQCGIQNGSAKVCCEVIHTTRKDFNGKCDLIECVILKNCNLFMEFLAKMEKPLKRSVVDFLRTQQCGFESGFPKVCCKPIPKSLRIFRNNKTRPVSALCANVGTEEDGLEFYQGETTVRTVEITSRRNKKVDKLDAFSDLLDIAGSFDLILREERSLDPNVINIEIR